MVVEGIERWRYKVALITGASSGIGKAIAHRLADIGMTVCLAARRREHLDALALELDTETAVFPVDVRDETAVEQACGQIRDRFGGLDVLVNNAGLGYQQSLLHGDTARWKEMLDVNVLGLCITTREGVALMRGRPEGHVFHLGSLSGHRVPPGSNVYGASKFAVRSLTESLRQELHHEQLPIRVTSISPGFVETEFHSKYFASREKSKQLYERFHVLDAKDIADAVAYALGAPPHVAVHDILVRSRYQES